MGKPYSDLEKQALAIIRGGGDPSLSKDAGIANYWTWRMNPADTSHDLPAASTRTTGRKLEYVALTPFADIGIADLDVKVSISQRSLAKVVGDLKTALGVETGTDAVGALPLGKFKPAKVYFRLGAATTATERTSRITKRKYKSVYAPGDEGYSIPFGKTTATSTQADRQAALKANLGTGTGAAQLITFTPEVYRG